jgi:hypothetical protein
MVPIAIGAFLALGSFYVARVKSERSRRSLHYLSQRRSRLALMGVQIICADCSGEELKPVKTYMDRHGTCETCGGRSYMLASKRGSEINQKRAAALDRPPSPPTGQEPARSGRLLAFRTTAG